MNLQESWEGLISNPSINYIISVNINLYCGVKSDKFVQCMINNCNESSVVPTSWYSQTIAMRQANAHFAGRKTRNLSIS